jgi:hypothetical protein
MRGASSHREELDPTGSAAPSESRWILRANASRLNGSAVSDTQDGLGISTEFGVERRNLYVVGGQQQSLRPVHAGTQPWYRYNKGLVLQVRPGEQTVETTLEYVSPAAVCPPENPAILFKQGTLVGDRIYLCTQTEVMVYSVPDFERLHYVSQPYFHDVHHVRPTPDGTLLVANTGLDMVIEITMEGELVREWSVADSAIWTRFSPDVDYRLVPSMKPHRAHPNHVFYIGSDIWVTRFEQRDAICLTDPAKRIDIGLERIHDGVAYDGRLYFSTVDGKIVIVSQITLKVEEVYDLSLLAAPGDLLGWCRGLYIEDGKVWVGFSRLRPTRFRDNVSWVVKGFRRILPTRIGCYDLEKGVCLAMVDLEPYGLNAVFSLHPAGG